MDSAEILPFGGPHLRTCGGGAWRVVREEGDDDGVDLLREEAAELVQPQRPLDVIGRLRQLERHLPVYCYGTVRADWVGEEVVEGFEVFGELECRVNLAYYQ